MYYIITVSILIGLSIPNLFAQEINSSEIVSLEKLEISLRNHCQEELEAEVEQYNYEVKGKGLAHLPTVGVTLGLPTVSWNTKSIYNLSNVKRINNAKIKSIKLKHTSLYNDQLQKLRIGYEKYKVQLSALKVKEELFQIDAEMFAIYKEAYAKQELTPLDFLKHKKDYHSKKADIDLYKKELLIVKLEIYEQSKYIKESKKLRHIRSPKEKKELEKERKKSMKKFLKEERKKKYQEPDCIMLSEEFEQLKNGQ